MKQLVTVLSLCLLVFSSCKEDKTEEAEMMQMGNLSLSTDKPMAGESLDLYYNSNAEDVEGTYYTIVKNKSYPMDLEFSKEDGQLKSTVKVPDSAQALAFNIKIDEDYDDNEKAGYVIPLYTKEGNQIAGSNAAVANYKVTYGSQFGIDEDMKNSLSVIKKDIEAHPDLKKDWYESYLNLHYRDDKKTAQADIDAYLAELGSKAQKDEADYTSMMSLYRMTRQNSKMDSIKAIAIDKYPNGSIAKNAYVDRFFASASNEEKEAIFAEYDEKYDDLGRMGSYMVNNLANESYKAGDTEKFKTYAAKLESSTERANLYNTIAWPLAEQNKDQEYAAEISKKSLELIKEAQNNLDDRPNFMSPNQYQKNLDYSYNMYSDTYGLILFNQGKVDEAIAIQEKALADGKNADMNERYIRYLMAANQHDKAETKAAQFIEKGHANQKIMEAYKTAYTKNHPESNDVDTKIAALEKTAYENYKSEIKNTMIDEEAPKFALKDTEGNEVSLESLKGKTVILDFWATWCGPCKASFPGMQKVVTKYKDDDSVKLLFIDTFENGDNREKLVTDFIDKNNYDFHVLYDPAMDNKYEVAEKYKVAGIPTKVIIGPDGRMKFKSVGYSGQVDKLVKEMDIMIDILKS